MELRIYFNLEGPALFLWSYGLPQDYFCVCFLSAAIRFLRLSATTAFCCKPCNKHENSQTPSWRGAETFYFIAIQMNSEVNQIKVMICMSCQN